MWASLGFFAIAGAPVLADVTIADLAPCNAIAILAIDDYATMSESFAATPFAAMLAEPAMKDWVGGVMSKQQHSLRDLIAPLDMKLNELPRPVGMFGAALWVDPQAVSPMIAHFLIAGRFGDNADAMDRVINAVLERSVNNKRISVTHSDLSGAHVRTVDLIDIGDKPYKSKLVAMSRTLFIVRLDDLIFVVSDQHELSNILERVAGGTHDSLRQNPELSAARKAVAPAPVFISVLADSFFSALDRLWRSDAGVSAAGGVTFEVHPILDALGFSQIKSLSYGVAYNTPEAPAQSRMSLLTPINSGLLALFNQPGGAFDPSPFITADTAEYRQIRFDYPGLLTLLNQVVTALPDQRRAAAQTAVALVEAAIGPMLQSVGPDTIYAKQIERPFTAHSVHPITAVRTSDPTVLAASLSQLGAILRLKSESIEGEPVWKSRNGGRLAILDGFLVSTTRPGMEAILRQSTTAQAPTLAQTPEFQHAANFTTPGGVYYEYTNLSKVMTFNQWSYDHWEPALRDRLRSKNADETHIKEEVDDTRLKRLKRGRSPLPPKDAVLPHLGDIVGETHVTDDGFFYRSAWFAASR